MFDRDFDELSEILLEAAETYGKPLGPAAVGVYFKALQEFPIEVIRRAVEAHYIDPERGRFMPMPADVFAQVANAKKSDGRPNADEAWAVMPKSESASAVVTREMLKAWEVAASLYETDEIGCRMAFRSSYERFVNEARARLEPIEWIPSMGFDPDGRAVAVDRALRAGLITNSQANNLLPAPVVNYNHLQIAASEAMKSELPATKKQEIAEFLKGLAVRSKKYETQKGERYGVDK